MTSRRSACLGLGATALTPVSWDRQRPLVRGDYAAGLAMLDDHWGWLADLLSMIRAPEDGELPDGSAAGLLVRPNGYVAVIRAGDWGDAYTASLIAHEAWHAHQHSQGRRYYGRLAEQEAWAVQAMVLADVSPSHTAIPWLLGSIAGLTDDGPIAGNPRD